jgi:plasmid stabilization system protein ParE
MHRVIITGPARLDLSDQHDWWAEHRSAEQATRWFGDFYRALESLAVDPEKHPLAPENGKWPFEVRQLTFGLGRKPSHRALFRIDGDFVAVLRTRHLAQAELNYDDIRSDA